MNTIVKSDPFRSVFPFTRLFENFEDFSTQRGLKIRETDKEIILDAVVAGVPAKNVDIDIEDGVITIKAENKEEKNSQEGHSSSYYQYYYTTALSGGQWDKAEAVVKDGIVVLRIPKTEASRPRKVNVKAE